MKNMPPPQGGGILADITKGKNMKRREEKKRENVKEKGRMRKDRGKLKSKLVSKYLHRSVGNEPM